MSIKPEKPSLGGQIKALFLWAWSAAWMFGLVTWSALIGNGPPYQANYLTMSYLNKRNLDESIQATMKISIGLVLFPIWWTFVQKCGDAFFGVAEQHVLYHDIACIIIGLGYVQFHLLIKRLFADF